MKISDLIELFDEAGICYNDVWHPEAGDGGYILLEAKRPGVRGYSGFTTEFHYNDLGNLVDVAIWE